MEEMQSRKIDHHLVNEPEYLSTGEVMTSHGFLTIMTLLWTPILIICITIIVMNKTVFRKPKKKR